MPALKYIEDGDNIKIRRSTDNKLIGYIRKNKTNGVIETGFYAFVVMTKAQVDELQSKVARFSRDGLVRSSHGGWPG